jgi:aryl-alcohol dehydrogenase-like predicted oxidoreductase
MQSEISLVMREEEREMLGLCRDQGVGMIPWSPLGAGKLTRPWGQTTKRSQTDRFNKTMYEVVDGGSREVVSAVEAVARARGVPMAQVAMAWLLHKDGITSPIIGATRVSHLEDAVAAVEFSLSPEEIEQIEAPYQPRAVPAYLLPNTPDRMSRKP